MTGKVLAVSRSQKHTFSKRVDMFIRLRAGLGVEGDAHMGETVQHWSPKNWSLVAKDPHAPNLRQVHLIHAELFHELKAKGFAVNPGEIGENITTSGLDLLSLPTGTKLHIGETAVVEVTGLRTPCNQLNVFAAGLKDAVQEIDSAGNRVRKSGIMGIVIADGQIAAGDAISVIMPDEPHLPLQPV